MGIKFGNLVKHTGITYFRLSPYEQNPFAGAVAGAGRMISRGVKNYAMIAPFFMMTYLLMAWANEKNHEISRKNPKDFENDT